MARRWPRLAFTAREEDVDPYHIATILELNEDYEVYEGMESGVLTAHLVDMHGITWWLRSETEDGRSVLLYRYGVSGGLAERFA